MRLSARALGLSLALIALPLSSVRADEVSDQINEALTAYRKKDLPTALAALDAAANLLRQARAESFKTLLPNPLPGWSGEEAEVNAIAAAMMGGGITASRKYSKGDAQVTVEIIADSPIVQSMAVMLSSPIMALGGGRQAVINGRRMTYMKDDNAFMTMVADRVLVKVSATRGTPEEALRAYVGALDFAAIEKLLRN